MGFCFCIEQVLVYIRSSVNNHGLLYSSLSYFEDQDIVVGNFSYDTGEEITDFIHMELSDSTFGFDGVSVGNNYLIYSP